MATYGTTQPTKPGQNAGASQTTGTTDWNQQPATGASVGIGDELRQLVREKTYEQIDTQKERATGTLGAVAGAVRNATQGLRDSGQPGLANYVTRAADEIDRFTSRLREQDLDDAVREVQQFARRKPAIFLGIAFGAGVLAARFFKSSGQSGGVYNAPRSQWKPSPSPAYTQPPSAARDTVDYRPDLSPSRGVL